VESAAVAVGPAGVAPAAEVDPVVADPAVVLAAELLHCS
jgi:hypothetical protein